VRTKRAVTPDAAPERATLHGVSTLPNYDVRIRQELAQRRFLKAIARRTTRVILIHLADAAVVTVAVGAAGRAAALGHVSPIVAPALGLTLLALHACGAFVSPERLRSPWRVASAAFIASATVLIFGWLPPHLELSFAFVALYAVFAAAGLIVSHLSLALAIRQAHKHGLGLRKAVIVGRHAEARAVASALEADEQCKHQVLGFVSTSQHPDPRALGPLDEIEAILDHLDPEEIILASVIERVQLGRVAAACVRRGIAMLAVPSWGRAIRGWAEPVRIGPLPGYHVHPARMGMPGLALKRATDVVATSLGLVVAAPVMALVAVAIKLDSRGPVFYRQLRVGLGGREFMMWKFRSMRAEADACLHEVAHLNSYEDERLFKAEYDPRITRVGRVLRRFSLDELPQLLNVLAGEMSLVGPRPPVPGEVRRYDRRHFVRLSVVPGMTGPWQVNGRNLIRDFEEVVRLEKQYIDSWSLREDLRIMARTVGVVLSGKGAY
jgi:exopolysaccharide biosynthesis polyprenyl glycosylphosphotransferase